MFEGMMDRFNQLISMMAADKSLYRVFIRGLNHPDRLDDDEAGSFSFMLRIYMKNYNKMYRAYRRGALIRLGYVRAVREHLRKDSVVDFWLGREKLLRASSL